MFAKVLLRETETNDAPSVNLNLNVRGLGQSDTLAINEQCAELICSGKEIFKFGLGQSPFPVPEQVVEALRANAHQKDYLPVKGLYALREAVADYHRRKDGVQRSADDVLIGPGSKELMFLMQLVYYGDLVIPTPSWVSYAPQAQIIGRQVRWIPTTSANYWLVTPDELEHVCESDPSRPRLLIINYPNNPTGHTYSREHLKELAEVAHKYRILLLSDEIYGEIHHEGKHVSIAQFYPEGTIISSGLSKWCGAGGWRLGTFIFPRTLRWLLDSMAAVASETFTSTSAPIQYAAVRAFQGGPEIETYLTRCRIVLRALARHCTQKLKDVGIKIYEPRGAFYLFPSFSPLQEKLEAHGITTSPQLCKRILEETGVAGLPGTSFGRPEHKLTLRLAYVDFDGEKVL
ncbi:MAG: pyridoxal phosphate-dependent aminotransferase, partial [Calditrichaeota bacterium]